MRVAAIIGTVVLALGAIDMEATAEANAPLEPCHPPKACCPLQTQRFITSDLRDWEACFFAGEILLEQSS